MNITSIMSQPNITVAVTPTDLQEFAQTIIERTFCEVSKNKEQKSEQYLTPNETAAMLSVSKNSLWRWNKVGVPVPCRSGAQVAVSAVRSRTIIK